MVISLSISAFRADFFERSAEDLGSPRKLAKDTGARKPRIVAEDETLR